MYRVDPYLYENTDILRNKFGIRNQDELDEQKADFTIGRLAELAVNPMDGKYDIEHLCQMHKYIFKDVFDWAGKFRAIDIEKSELSLAGLSVKYSSHTTIKTDLSSALHTLKDNDWETYSPEKKADSFARGLAVIWKVHPFREGNTRTITHFCCQYFDSLNDSINRKLFENNIKYFRNSLVAANAVLDDIGDRSDISFLYKIVLDAIK